MCSGCGDERRGNDSDSSADYNDRAVRSLKVDYNLKPSMDIEVIIRDENGKNMPSVSYINAILQKMCHATWIDEDSAVEMAVRPILNGTLNVPLAAIINVEEEIEKTEQGNQTSAAGNQTWRGHAEQSEFRKQGSRSKGQRRA